MQSIPVEYTIGVYMHLTCVQQHFARAVVEKVIIDTTSSLARWEEI